MLHVPLLLDRLSLKADLRVHRLFRNITPDSLLMHFGRAPRPPHTKPHTSITMPPCATSPARRRQRASRSPAKLRPPTSLPTPHICYPGGATFFWWQIGAATRLAELYDLDGIEQSGFSAGALAAVLSRCGVDPLEAHRVAFTLADDAGVFTNPLGLAFNWGRLVDEWLRTLLPEEAAMSCDGCASVVVTKLTPLPRIARIVRHCNRDQLISCLLASAHIPYFMDGKFSRTLPAEAIGGAAALPSHCSPSLRAVDGGLLEFIGLVSAQQILSHGAPPGSPPIALSAEADADFQAACAAHGWHMLNPNGTDHFIEYGARYVEAQAALGAAGRLAPLAPYRRRSSTTSETGTWRRPLPHLPSRAPSRGLGRLQSRPFVAFFTLLAILFLLVMLGSFMAASWGARG